MEGESGQDVCWSGAVYGWILLVFNTTYDLPFGKGRTHMSSAPQIVEQAFGGWQLGCIA